MTNSLGAWKMAKRIHDREKTLKNFQNVERQRHALNRLRSER